jgi:hypothetical protein
MGQRPIDAGDGTLRSLARVLSLKASERAFKESKLASRASEKRPIDAGDDFN